MDWLRQVDQLRSVVQEGVKEFSNVALNEVRTGVQAVQVRAGLALALICSIRMPDMLIFVPAFLSTPCSNNRLSSSMMVTGERQFA